MPSIDLTIIPPERLALLEATHLESGAHRNFEDGACALELVAHITGEASARSSAHSCAHGTTTCRMTIATQF